MSTPQQRRRSAALLAAALAVALGGIAWISWQDRQHIEQATRPLLAGIALTDFAIVRPGRKTIALEKTASGDTTQWRITEPCYIAADTQRIEPLIAALESITDRYALGDLDVQAAGLTDTATQLLIDGEPLLIGDLDLSEERRYVAYRERAGFAPAWLGQLLDGGLSAIGQLDFLPPATSQLTVTTDNGAATANGDALSELTAQQIVAWPNTNSPPIDWNGTLTAETADDTATEYRVTGHEGFVAIEAPSSGCAWLVPMADWDGVMGD